MDRNLPLKQEDIKEWLETKFLQYACPDFIEQDPISIPHRFTLKQDREISGFLTATLSWGQRPTILKNAWQLMLWMDSAPYDFILNHKPADRKPFLTFVHRTFQGQDCVFFLEQLQRIYQEGKGLEGIFSAALSNASDDLGPVWFRFRQLFCGKAEPGRTTKHLPNTMKGAAAKRWNMWLRWMVRPPSEGVDFGIWKVLSPSLLHIPLDVHVGHTARKTNLLYRKQNDWKAVRQLTLSLRRFHPQDPCRYDYSLYGLGVFEGF